MVIVVTFFEVVVEELDDRLLVGNMEGFNVGKPDIAGLRKTGCVGGTTDFGILDCVGSAATGCIALPPWQASSAWTEALGVGGKVVDDVASFRFVSLTALVEVTESVFLTLTEDTKGEGCSE
jgi:hypothetical protein